MSWLEPIEGCCEAEDTGEARGGLLIACGDGPPLLEPDPETLDLVAGVLDPVRAGDGRLMAPGRDRGPCAHGSDVLAESVTGVATVTHDLLRSAGKHVEQ